jgi:hypothetical protein
MKFHEKRGMRNSAGLERWLAGTFSFVAWGWSVECREPKADVDVDLVESRDRRRFDRLTIVTLSWADGFDTAMILDLLSHVPKALDEEDSWLAEDTDAFREPWVMDKAVWTLIGELMADGWLIDVKWLMEPRRMPLVALHVTEESLSPSWASTPAAG